jgi:hypothetical protein
MTCSVTWFIHLTVGDICVNLLPYTLTALFNDADSAVVVKAHRNKREDGRQWSACKVMEGSCENRLERWSKWIKNALLTR